jgi:hypothetical protein
MEVAASVIIHAPLEVVWQTFTDVACWQDWNAVIENRTDTRQSALAEGNRLQLCIRPFAFPVAFEPEVQEIVPHERVVWTGGRYWIHARHEFTFENLNGAVRVTSREVFNGLPLVFAGFIFPKRRIRKMVVALLDDLKSAAESRDGTPKEDIPR